jgi:hypothetical protein
MARIDDFLIAGLKTLPPKDSVPDKSKQNYSQRMSQAVANAFGAELRERGMEEARPAGPGVHGKSGAERRMSGGIGAKRVDVTWSTEQCGLLFACSVKTINWRDGKSGNYQKNLTNRRGDLLFEAVTLHRRYPYSVLFGFLWLDHEAENDDTSQRRSTFVNAHHRLRMFTGREDPAGRDEQYERLYVVSVDANPFAPSFKCYAVGEPKEPVSFEDVFNEAQVLIANRNPDFYTINPETGLMDKLRS